MTGSKRPSAVAIVGNGIMGAGIAEVFATGGYPVRLLGRRRESLDGALARIEVSLTARVDRGLLVPAGREAALALIVASTELGAAAGADLVIEAIGEDLDLKREIFGRLDRICPPPAVLASASGHPASEIVGPVEHRERVLAIHFWNPPPLLPLVEVCAGPETDPALVPWAVVLLRELGKQPVVLEREIDGFIGNRLQFALWREALALWAEGVASAADIDRAVTGGIGRRLGLTGPLATADLGGLGTFDEFGKFLFPDLDRGTEPPRRLAEFIAAAGEEPHGLLGLSGPERERLLAEREDELYRWLGRDA